jgi:hypothetical protein
MGHESKALTNFYAQLNKTNPTLANRYQTMNNGSYNTYYKNRTPEEKHRNFLKAGTGNNNSYNRSGSSSTYGSPNEYSSSLSIFCSRK